MSIPTYLRRTGTVAATGAALALVAAGPASAHHCLKEWNDAARAQVSSGTAWMAMSDFVGFAIVNFLPGGTPECAAHADEITADYLTAAGIATEPTVHMKATTGGGAAHQGKVVKPFDYIEFGIVEGLIAAEEDCAGVVFE
ncbi:hypothetical protein FHP29_21245 [Nocardioides albidus]|uniref:Uncharacterized protein n=1 Tax=Nocardioides albidus TaxID=1517589 RepID=A0A5C4VLD3_9ACTN|nr:hypothetical protein [Nocardioides albidus]TNM36650.1 hypothetical protein FHP29_21245 [Nocardioides albidus]